MEILARAVGRRKEAVAQVQLVRGNGQFIINDKPAQAYLQNNSCSLICIKAPLQAALSLFSSKVENGNLLRIEGESEPTPLGETSLSNNLEASFLNPVLIEVSPKTQNHLLPSDSSDTINDLTQPAHSQVNVEGAQEGEIDIIVKVKGGGLIGQAEAIKLGVARAFCIMENASGEAQVRKLLKAKGYLTQDSRVKERKKYGLKKARKASQYHKR